MPTTVACAIAMFQAASDGTVVAGPPLGEESPLIEPPPDELRPWPRSENRHAQSPDRLPRPLHRGDQDPRRDSGRG